MTFARNFRSRIGRLSHPPEEQRRYLWRQPANVWGLKQFSSNNEVLSLVPNQPLEETLNFSASTALSVSALLIGRQTICCGGANCRTA